MSTLIEVKSLGNPWFDVYVFRLGGSDSRKVALLFTNATERKHTEEAIHTLNEKLEERVKQRTKDLENSQEKDRANLQRLEEIVEAMPWGTIAVDEFDRILHTNEALCTIFRLRTSPSELIGKSWKEVFRKIKSSTLHPELYLQQIQDVLESKQPEANHEIQLKDGRTILRDYIPIVAEGMHHGHLFLYRDITQGRRIDLAKSEFMSLASHQLRTPLTAMRWTMGRLQKSFHDRATLLERKLIADGKVSAARMSDTIDTMLHIARIESGMMKLKRQDICICDMLKDIVELYRDVHTARLQAVIVECPKDLFVRTDPQLLKEALSNLLNNAIKYTPESGKIQIRAKKENGKLVIEVQDSGYGIPAHQQDKIFSKFFRGENVVGKETAGTGLGLYLVSLIASVLDGKISFTSKEGQGSTFSFSLNPLSPYPHERSRR